jgi:hypothetical protein
VEHAIKELTFLADTCRDSASHLAEHHAAMARRFQAPLNP